MVEESTLPPNQWRPSLDTYAVMGRNESSVLCRRVQSVLPDVAQRSPHEVARPGATGPTTISPRRYRLPHDDIVGVRYYTARIKPLDDPGAPQRQQIYLRALRTLPDTTLHFGYFQIETKWRRLAQPIAGNRSARVLLPEEKGSDVNLATHLVADGFQGRYEKAAVLTNDADLAEPIRLVQDELKVPVALVYPTAKPAGEMRKANPADLLKLSLSTVRKSQFPDQLTDAKGIFHKPKGW